MRIVLALLLVCAGLACRGKINTLPIETANFTLVSTHQYGEKHVYHMDSINQNYYLIKLHGNSYQAGVAYGTLMKDQIKNLIHDLWAYYYGLVEEEFKFITKLPPSLQPMGRAFAIKLYKSLLMANHYVTRPYIPKRFIQELQGLADGSGVPLHSLIEVNMIPEYTRAGCSILGAWNKATKSGGLLHLRALDWDVHNPMNKYPTIVRYDLIEKKSNVFVNVGWAGMIGSITGFSEKVGVGEKVRKQNPVKQNQTRLGKPWTYAVRDVLQFANTIDDSLHSLNTTRRTCSVYLGISSTANNTFRLIQYSHKQFRVYDDHNFPFTSTHVQLDGINFMPIHDDSDSCFNDLVKGKYGDIDADWIMNVLAPLHKTGDTQLVVYDYKAESMLLQVSYGNKLSFQRPGLRIDMKGMYKSRYSQQQRQ